MERRFRRPPFRWFAACPVPYCQRQHACYSLEASPPFRERYGTLKLDWLLRTARLVRLLGYRADMIQGFRSGEIQALAGECLSSYNAEMDPTADITGILAAIRAGDQSKLDALFDAVYGRLHELAHYRRLSWQGNATLNTTALVHEAYLKLIGGGAGNWEDRRHFFNAASKAMRHILIDYAEKRCAARRGGGVADLDIDALPIADESTAERLIMLDDALTQLESHNPRLGQIVEHRFFGGLTIGETAEALDVSPATVKRDWTFASAWLRWQLDPAAGSN